MQLQPGRQVALLLLLLLAAVPRHVTEAAAAFSSGRLWWSSLESLSDYEAVRSHSVQNEPECIVPANSDSAVQLVAFNASSGQCAHFRCRLGLSHCRKCRNANKGAQRLWTAGSDCWTTVQHRVSGSVDFYRNWTQYQSEFGEGPDGNYWIGLNSLHALTASGPRKLRILMKAWNDSEHWAEYSSFSVGPESDNYRLSVSGFSGSAGIGDCLDNNNGMQFSTKDADHDTSTDNCATTHKGAWWFRSCHCAHPNGEYKDSSAAIGGAFAKGVIWRKTFGFYYSLKEIEMLLLSGLCALFRCRLGLSHCRKCRNANKGAQRVWTAGSDCWTTVQHRVSGSVDFYRNWTQYQSDQFSTMDADHDDSSSSCAENYSGGWWFQGCYSTHPNGVYKNFTDAIGGPFGHGIIWKYYYGFYYSLMEFEMLII
uniref:Fibrinogen C-terminal domain-containing protein n=1 Tax=Macrostomum lignano TaxID=282301 RepID=A0A1I8J4E8_9PLAT